MSDINHAMVKTTGGDFPPRGDTGHCSTWKLYLVLLNQCPFRSRWQGSQAFARVVLHVPAIEAQWFLGHLASNSGSYSGTSCARGPSSLAVPTRLPSPPTCPLHPPVDTHICLNREQLSVGAHKRTTRPIVFLVIFRMVSGRVARDCEPCMRKGPAW